MGKTQNDMRKMHQHYFTIIIVIIIASFQSSFFTIKYRTWEIYVYKRVSFSKSLVGEWTQSSPDSMNIHCYNTTLQFAGYSYRVYQAIFIMVKTLKKISVWLKIRHLFLCKWNIVLYMQFIWMYLICLGETHYHRSWTVQCISKIKLTNKTHPFILSERSELKSLVDIN